MSNKHSVYAQFMYRLDLVSLDKQRDGSWLARYHERLTGGGHSERPVCRATGRTVLQAAKACVLAYERILLNVDRYSVGMKG